MMARLKSKVSRRCALILSLAGAIHFLIGVFLWAVFLYADMGQHLRRHLIGALPAFLLLTWFSTATVLALRRLRMSVWLVATGLVVSVALFSHDAATRNYQLHAEDFHAVGHQKTFYYFTWWWYDESWRH